MASSSSSSTSIIPKAEYEVFFSFRGKDSRKKFTSHLHEAFRQKKIIAFIDDELERGEGIFPALSKAIEQSRISVIIFSKQYASSRWCLKELEKILECKNKYGKIVIPIFYEVDPSDVRNQTRDFGKAFSKLEKRFVDDLEMLQGWRTALRDAANLSGFHSKDHRSDASLVSTIVDDIFKRLFPNSITFDTKDLVGLDSSIEEIKNLLCREGVRNLGIWGIGGVGKTTFAKVVFNKIFRQFEASFFIEDIRAGLEKSGGLNDIHQKLSHALFGDLYPNIGFNFQSEWLRRKNVLIVFDDMIANDKQTKFLKEISSCLNSESLLIITTREKQVLLKCGVHKRHIYEMKELCFNDALQLFSLHAFGENRPTEDCFDLSTRIVEFCKGLPLALNVLGAHLFKKTREDWESALKSLEISGAVDFDPNIDILRVLKISYDGLTNTEKDLFLDIVCFFEGYERDRIEAILNAHGFNSCFYINDLIQKSLITESFGTIKKHDLLQEMGRKIVQNESINDLGKRSRLWYHEDIVKVLQNNEGTSAIRSIRLDLSKVPELHLNPIAFDNMQNLRFLAFYRTGHGKKVHESDSSALCLISRFLEKICSRGEKKVQEKEDDMESYVTKHEEDDMESYVTKHEEDDMESNGTEHEEDDMQNPRFLEFKGFEHEKKVPESDSSALYLILRFLEKICSWGEKKAHGFGALKFDFCELRYLSWNGYSAKSLPPKFNPKNLVALHMPNSKVEKLWTGNQKLANLKHIDLSHSEHLYRMPDLSLMRNLESLILEGCTKLRDSFSSIQNLHKLVILNLRGCKGIGNLAISVHCKSLKKINLSNCSNLKTVPYLPAAVEELNLDGTSIKELISIERLSKLKELSLKNCSCLERLPKSVRGLKSLKKLCLSSCSKLGRLPNNLENLTTLENLRLEDCNIEELPDNIGQLLSLEYLVIGQNNFESLPASIKDLSKLVMLDVSNCKRLKSLPELPRKIWGIKAHNCISLESLSILSFFLFGEWVMTRSFFFFNCSKLQLDMEKESLKIETTIDEMYHIEEKEDLIEMAFICYPGSDIPNWFTFKSTDCFIEFPLSDKSIGFVLCVVVSLQVCQELARGKIVYLFSIDGEVSSVGTFVGAVEVVQSDHVLFGFDYTMMYRGLHRVNLNSKGRIEFFFEHETENGKAISKMKKCGVRLLYGKDDDLRREASVDRAKRLNIIN